VRAGKSPTSRAFSASRRPFRQTFPVPPTLVFFRAASAAIGPADGDVLASAADAAPPPAPGDVPTRHSRCGRRRGILGASGVQLAALPRWPGRGAVARACLTPGGRGHAGAPSPNAAPAGLRRLRLPRDRSYLPLDREDR
jgi:hypothetical protein